jgi:hypothetical protein
MSFVIEPDLDPCRDHWMDPGALPDVVDFIASHAALVNDRLQRIGSGIRPRTATSARASSRADPSNTPGGSATFIRRTFGEPASTREPPSSRPGAATVPLSEARADANLPQFSSRR